MTTKQTTATILAALAVINLNPNAAIAADKPAAPLFGSADWKASPTDPVGFCGQGNNNWYPGATPPLEWWDGTSAKVKTRRAVPFYPGEYDNEMEADGFADSKSKNILWKVPLPGWGDSLPVAVGKYVITLSSPHYVTCWDAHTGKVLWQDELGLMTVPVLSADRKSILSVTDPAKAAVAQSLFERTLAYNRVRLAATGFTRDFKNPTKWQWTARKPLLEHAISVLERWKTELKADFPDIGPALEGEQALLRDCLANKSQEERQASGLPGQKPFGGHSGSAPAVYSNDLDLSGYTRQRLGLLGGQLINGWGAWTSDTFSTPVSDGEVVCVMFGHGQLATYDLATGKRLWAWRDPLMSAGSVSHLPSPMLWKDLMIFMAPGRDTARPPAYSTTLMAVEKRTGKLHWEVSGGPGGCPWGGSHGDHMSPVLVRLGDRAVVVSNRGAVIDPETGATLAQLPNFAGPETTGRNRGHWGSGHVLAIDGRVLRGAGSDGGGTPVSVWPMRFVSGNLKVEEGFIIPQAKTDQGTFAACPRFFVTSGNIFDSTNGKLLAQLPRDVSNNCTLIGNLLISPKGNDDVEMRREDLLRVTDFAVLDMSDPSSPRLLSTRSRLGGLQLPADIADKYFPEFRKPELKRFGLGGYLAIGAYFGHRVGGLTALGNRLYIRSQTHLYCIGPAVLGGGADDPKVVAAIRAATSAADIAKYLDGDSAQYRYEAVKRIRGQESGGRSQELNGKLEALAKSDQYEEIRAESMRVLGLEAGKPGFAILKQAISAEIGVDPGDVHIGLGDTVMTLRAMGVNADPVLAAMLTDADIKVRRSGALAAGIWPSGSATLRDALIPLAADRSSEQAFRTYGVPAAAALSKWPVDPSLTTLFTKIVNNGQDWTMHPYAMSYLMRALPEDQKNAILVTASKAWNGHSNIPTLVDRGALNEIRTLVSETKDRIQAGIIQALCSASVASGKPELRKFAAEMSMLALQKPSADTHALGGIANAVRTLGADAAPALPLLKAMKPEELKDAAKPVAEAIAEIEAKLSAAAAGEKK